MKESDRKFEKLLKEAVCSYHKEEMDALPSEEELQDIQLSDDFYRKMDGLVKKQKRRWQYRFVRYGAVAASFLLFTFGTVGAAAYALMGAENFKAFFKKHAKEYHVADSAVMDLEQLTDMAVTTAGTVYEDDNIRLDLKGLIPEERIQQIIDTVVARGGYVKDLHGQKNVYYQVNATYYSALGEDDKKMLMARALQMFMPGKPQVWYLDLFAGKNDHEAVKRAGAGGHKEINRTNLSAAQIEELMKTDIVKEQLKLLHFRNVSKAFGFDADLAVSTEGETITFTWTNQGESATLRANLKTFEYEITDSEGIYA